MFSFLAGEDKRTNKNVYIVNLINLPLLTLSSKATRHKFRNFKLFLSSIVVLWREEILLARRLEETQSSQTSSFSSFIVLGGKEIFCLFSFVRRFTIIKFPKVPLLAPRQLLRLCFCLSSLSLFLHDEEGEVFIAIVDPANGCQNESVDNCFLGSPLAALLTCIAHVNHPWFGNYEPLIILITLMIAKPLSPHLIAALLELCVLELFHSSF